MRAQWCRLFGHRWLLPLGQWSERSARTCKRCGAVHTLRWDQDCGLCWIGRDGAREPVVMRNAAGTYAVRKEP